MDNLSLIIFTVTYLGLILGGIPGLALDRTGIALLGMIAFLISGRLDLPGVWYAVDLSTLTLLFGLMILSAQFRLSGFYSWLVRRFSRPDMSPRLFLIILIAASALLSALLANDIVCLAMTPVLVESCYRLRLDPKPYLLGLVFSANIGSAATLIGNPQIMLIGQTLNLPFGAYLLDAFVPVVLSLVVLWFFLARRSTAPWPDTQPDPPCVHAPVFSKWESAKGMVLMLLVIGLFLFTSLPRDMVTLAAAAILLCSRRMHSREMLGLVDWQLLMLFIALFIVNHGFTTAGGLQGMQTLLTRLHMDLAHWPWLMLVGSALSNLLSNVPSVMLLLSFISEKHLGVVLAISSTFAGNLLIIGSIANIIMVEQASKHGVTIHWREHARLGVPLTLITLVIAAGWFWLRGY